MSEMIERVAMKLAEVRHKFGNDYGLKRAKVMAIDLMATRAALEAMREPSEAMNVAGWQKADERDAILGNGEIAMIWQAMIDTALNERSDT